MMEYSYVKDKKKCIFQFLEQKLYTNKGEKATEALQEYTRTNFFSPYFKFKKACHQPSDRLLTKHSVWLSREFIPPTVVLRCCSETSSTPVTEIFGKGRPREKFNDCSEGAKRKRIEDIRKLNSTSDVSHATAMKLRERNGNTSKILLECTTTTPTKSQRILRIRKKFETESTCLSTEEALALIMSLNLSKHCYSVLRTSAISHDYHLSSSYYHVLKSKQQFYPCEITISESKYQVILQQLLNKTCKSFVRTFANEIPTTSTNFILHCKWGFDGYIRKFSCSPSFHNFR